MRLRTDGRSSPVGSPPWAGDAPVGFSRILVDVDATASVQPALECAANLARRSGASLRIVDAMSTELPHRVPSAVDEERRAGRREKLARLAERVRDVVAETDVLAGTPADALIDEVERHGHDLLVRAHARDVAARDSGVMGQVDRQLFRRCPCPVWAVGAGMLPQHPRIVCAVQLDDVDAARQALRRRVLQVAQLLTHLQRGTLVLLHAWQPFGDLRVSSNVTGDEYEQFVNDSRHRLSQDLGALAVSSGSLVGVRRELRRGHVEDVLPEFVVSEGIDLVVMGTLGNRSLARRWRGSTVERVSDRLWCSLVAVKPEHAATER